MNSMYMIYKKKFYGSFSSISGTFLAKSERKNQNLCSLNVPICTMKNIRSCKFHDGGSWSCTSARGELHERSWRLLMVFAQNFGPVVGTYEGHLLLSEQR